MGDLRSVEARKADVLGVLEGQRDLWLATGDRSGRPHLIAVSAWWDGNDLVVATTAKSRTAANLAAGGDAHGSLPEHRGQCWLRSVDRYHRVGHAETSL